jgi:beta-lactamase class A
MNDEIQRLNSAFSGEVGVYCMLDGEEFAEFQANERFATASTIKVFVLGAMLEGVTKGLWSLDMPVVVTPEDVVGGSGILKGLSPPLTLPLRDIATLMMTLSDNTATNVLIDQIGGVDAVNEHIRRAGLLVTRMGCCIDFDLIGDDFEKLGVSTPREMAVYLEGVRTRQLLEEKEAERFMEFMRFQHYLDLFPRHLPFNPYAADLGQHQMLTVANKTGFVPGIRCDTGYLLEAGRVISYCVMSHGCSDPSFNVDNEANRLLGQIGELVYAQAFSRPAPTSLA